MEKPIPVNELAESVLNLPPGFRFYPSDEEIIQHYLKKKVENRNFTAVAVGEADLNMVEPWDLRKIARTGENELYFFSQKGKKYPHGPRANRATESGYWKATGKDKEIRQAKTDHLIGMKKTLVFYKGRAPHGEKSNWVIHEYRLEGHFSYQNLARTAKEEWIICRVFHKSTGTKRTMDEVGLGGRNNFLDFSSPPPLMDSSNMTDLPGPSCFSSMENEFKPMNPASRFPQHLNYPPQGNNVLNPNSVPSQNPSGCFVGHVPNPVSNCSLYDMSGRFYPFSYINNEEFYYNQPKRCKVEEFPVNPSVISMSDTGASTAISDISSGLTPNQGGAAVTSSNNTAEDFEELEYWNLIVD